MVEAGSQAKTKIKLMTHVFRHPKFYRIPRDKSDQAISSSPHDGVVERAPGLGQSAKLQAPSVKPQAPQASSDKRQAPSSKRQA